MARTITLRSPDVSEGYTEWLNKSIEYRSYDAPNEHEELFRDNFYIEWDNDLLKLFDDDWLKDATGAKLSPYLLTQIPHINPDRESLIDFCCLLLAACIKYPNATIEIH